MMTYNDWIVLGGTSLIGANAGLIGTFAVLRRRALTGDALAHAALPGVCLAFLLVGARSLPFLLLGALATGVLGITIIAAVQHWTRIKADAAIGIVLSVFFGAGMVLSRLVQDRVSGGTAGLDSYILGKTAGMLREDLYLIGSIFVLCLCAVGLLYKEFKLHTFDHGFAQAQGWPVFRLDLLLMTLLALTVVVGLSTVGVVMIAALLIIPAATARFWTERLGVMLLLAIAVGEIMAVVGALISTRYAYMPAGPVIVLVGTFLFGLSSLFAPRRGLVARTLSERAFRQRLRLGTLTLEELEAENNR